MVTRMDRRPAAVVPVHWWMLLSHIAIAALVVLAVTGIVLALFYRPSTEPVTYGGSLDLYAGRQLPAAFASVVAISHDVPGGLLIRRLHRVAAHVFVLATVLHLLQVLFTGAFRRPRRANHIVGVVLGVFALAWAYSGLNLPYDVVAGTSLRVGYSLLVSIPYAGDLLAPLFYGGDFPSGDIIRRLWLLHLFVIPALFLAGVTVHVLAVLRATHAQPPVPGVDTEGVVVGDRVGRAALLRFIYVAALSTGTLLVLAVLVPWSDVALAGPYVPGYASNTLQPDWYLFWPEGAMRILPAIDVDILGTTLTNPFVAAVALPVILIAVVAVFPWLDALVTGDRGMHHTLQHPLDVPPRFAAVVGLTVLVLVLSVGATDDLIAESLGVSVDAVVLVLRALLVVGPPTAAWVAYRYAASQPPRWHPGT